MRAVAVFKITPQRPFVSHPLPGQDVTPTPVRASPDELSSPNPTQADPLLQVQQTTPRPGESQPQSADETDPEARVDAREASDPEGPAGGEQGGVEEEDGEDGQAAGEDTAGGGLPPPRGGDDEAEESEGPKEPADDNNNSMETPQNCQENFITIPEITEQVRRSSSRGTFHRDQRNKPPSALSCRSNRKRKPTVLMKSRWFWWTALVLGPLRPAWMTATRSKSSSP